jgi:uncharacterized membrane protein YecN with MAPEG domain
MHPHHITAASLAVLAVLLTALSVRISALRLRYRTSFGDGGHKDLLLAIRAHGNTLEQTTLYGLLALAYAGLPSAHNGYLLACSASFVLARVGHALAMFTRQLSLRQATHVVSVLAQLGLVLFIGELLWRLA